MTKFHYAGKAREVEDARRALHAAFAKVTRRGDETDPATRAWLDAIARFNAALETAYPPDFRRNFEQLRRVSRIYSGLNGAPPAPDRPLSKGDARALEAAIDFLVADPMFFRSGYAKAALIPIVTRLPLTERQKERLRALALAVVDSRASQEFRRYCRLARRIDCASFRDALIQRACGNQPAAARRAGWMLDALHAQDGNDRPRCVPPARAYI